jgi:phosphoserine phosphatase
LTTKVLLCRHGHVEGISPPRFRGRADVPLDQRGGGEASALARRIGAEFKPAAIYASPLQRCLQTAEAIGEATALPVVALEGLVDIDYGDWQWKTHDEVRRVYPEDFSAWLNVPWLVRFPKGESLQDLLLRTADVLRFVLNRHSGDTVVLVGHESASRAMLLQVLAQPLTDYWKIAQAPCAISEFDVTRNTVHVTRINDSTHLRTT